MKAVSVVLCEEATGVTAGRVARQGRRDIENEEIQMYLSKLKDLVPFMPKNRKLSKLEVIQNVIEYICDLQTALETHPALDAAIAAVVTTNATPGGSARRSSSGTSSSTMSSTSRQPLGVRSSPNTILSACEAASLPQHLTTTPEKLSPSSDGRPVSC